MKTCLAASSSVAPKPRVRNGYPLQDAEPLAVKLGQLRLDADIDMREMHQATDHF